MVYHIFVNILKVAKGTLLSVPKLALNLPKMG